MTGRHHAPEDLDGETVSLAQIAAEARDAHLAPEADDTWATELHHIDSPLRGAEARELGPEPGSQEALDAYQQASNELHYAEETPVPVYEGAAQALLTEGLPPEARAAWNQFATAVRRERETYEFAVNNAAELHATSVADAEETYRAALAAADRLYAATLDTALESCAEATDQARRARDRALDKHRHSLTPGVALEPTAVHPPKRRRTKTAVVVVEEAGDELDS